MSDTDSIKTDKSQSDLQQKYDKLAMEFAKVNIFTSLTLKLKIIQNGYVAVFFLDLPVSISEIGCM